MRDKLLKEAKVRILMQIRGLSRKDAIRMINMQRKDKDAEENRSADLVTNAKISKQHGGDEGEFMSAEEFFKDC